MVGKLRNEQGLILLNLRSLTSKRKRYLIILQIMQLESKLKLFNHSWKINRNQLKSQSHELRGQHHTFWWVMRAKFQLKRMWRGKFWIPLTTLEVLQKWIWFLKNLSLQRLTELLMRMASRIDENEILRRSKALLRGKDLLYFQKLITKLLKLMKSVEHLNSISKLKSKGMI